MASKLKNLKECRHNENTCSPFSLPNNVSICPQTIRNSCWNAVKDVLFPQCMKQKSCIVQEYQIVESERFNIGLGNEELAVEQTIRDMGGSDEVVQTLLDGPDETVLFYVAFDSSDWSNGDRARELQVEVQREYYVCNEFALVANVGGQVGLFLGGSFLGCFEWFVGRFSSIFNRFQRNLKK